MGMHAMNTLIEEQKQQEHEGLLPTFDFTIDDASDQAKVCIRKATIHQMLSIVDAMMLQN
jgi:hypothetical protein